MRGSDLPASALRGDDSAATPLVADGARAGGAAHAPEFSILAGVSAAVSAAPFDSAERRRVEHSLRETAQRLRITYERAPFGIAECDLQGRFIAVNARFCEQIGYTAA